MKSPVILNLIQDPRFCDFSGFRVKPGMTTQERSSK